MNTFQENGRTEITINGRRITERCIRPLPRDLKASLDNLYTIGRNAAQTRYWDADEPIDFNPPIFDSPGFPFNFESIQSRIQAHMQRIQAKVNEATSRADAIVRASQEAQTNFTDLVQEKLPNQDIQFIVTVEDCVFVNGTPIDQLL